MYVAVAGLGWWAKQIIESLKNSLEFEVLYGVDPMAWPGITDFVAQIHLSSDGFRRRFMHRRVEVLATPHLLHDPKILAAVATHQRTARREHAVICGGRSLVQEGWSGTFAVKSKTIQ